MALPAINSTVFYVAGMALLVQYFAALYFFSPPGLGAQFGAAEGVIRTRVGYSGGSMRNPTYRHLNSTHQGDGVSLILMKPEGQSLVQLTDQSCEGDQRDKD
ncbi:Peptide methionine sulfoxide reductase MsrA [Portunus trituberculatus]|uniref:peptide-methionine (S)-S-oxide reductase n=1 Tax=Portunus trituberculatus TaxID=210409 RepID=A0A5B7DRU7_PORTR|nr:Peptide methionine sulfoxide reductase MsrA [Portunus trituberculatus]